MPKYQIYNEDDCASPYVYEVTEDEQIDVAYVGKDLADCQGWLIQREPDGGKSGKK